ncbi:hypothetical protein FN976_01945 [Caenimonas sedimenti]|uniref:Uncharacterized protein n=1 Tax=Caenimonas sedimenti TaxID=2596921 RepID=A0A562ZXB3_9BURK|nr:hypothetical protein [Caenimonas sedimenti]TWO73021.1 hypothetical protein FN976_01945 [Caenimonas sedimenti]
MTFQLHSPHIQDFFKHPHGCELLPTPVFMLNALSELGREVRGMQLVWDGDEPTMRYVERTYHDVCALVDWAAGILSKCLGSPQLTEALVLNTPTHSEKEPREALFGIIEFWHQFDEEGEGPHLNADDYPHPTGNVVPYTTIGNVAAALGIAILDRLLVHRPNLSSDEALADLGAAWQCAFFAGRSNHFELLRHFWAEKPAA